jgi:hypothetical protein
MACSPSYSSTSSTLAAVVPVVDLSQIVVRASVVLQWGSEVQGEDQGYQAYLGSQELVGRHLGQVSLEESHLHEVV